MVLRDRDANTAWASASDGTLEERRAYAQNWRGDVAAVLSDNGKMVEWVKYSAYGVPFALPAGDNDSDGAWDAGDAMTDPTGYDVRWDADLDGDTDAADDTHASSIAGGYQTLGRGVLSSTGVNNRKGYAGYERDPAFGGAGRHLHHVRYRVYDADLGRWLQRDPQGYSDGMSLYGYVQAMAVIAADPWGLLGCQTQECVRAGTLVLPRPIILPRPAVLPRPIVTPRPVVIPRPAVLPWPPAICPTTELPIDYPVPIWWPSETWLPLPQVEPGIRVPPYPKNPDPNSKNPCSHLVQAYKALERQLANLNPKKAASCEEAMRNYAMMIQLWMLRWQSDRCHFANGISDGEHGTATIEAANRRKKFYDAMRDICNDELRRRLDERERQWREWCRQHPEQCA